VRWETPWLALMQDTLRSPALDSYFAYTANLGTHTFFMVFLPIQFWCGYTSLGRATCFMLAAGVYWSGFLKDMLCLPRPLSPPLARISMSGSAALEYGFPSSHSTNAVSIAFYAIYTLRASAADFNPHVYVALQALFYFYALSIVVGRLYCGMHGFLDVAIGSLLGALITVFQLAFGDAIDAWIFSGAYRDIILATLVVFVLVRIHPEPADDCPCFDDSVAFSGVVVGINMGAWHYAQSGFALNDVYPSTVPFDFEEMGWLTAALRTLLGVVIIFVWRAAMKPALFVVLPPLFRILERGRMNLPRAFFLNASKYTSIPTLRDDDNVIPPASMLPQMLKNLAHPRKRSVSVGPQSASDAYETLAYRNRRRRESVNSIDSAVLEDVPWSASSPTKSQPAAEEPSKPLLGAGLLPTPMASRVHSYERMMGTGNVHEPGKNINTPPESDTDVASNVLQTMQSPTEEENEKREIFMQLTKPRVRYDVEVVTKLIIYSGIGWLAVGINPILFELVGLGMGIRP
jgi:membrane-associated phospholipid phosphatase